MVVGWNVAGGERDDEKDEAYRVGFVAGVDMVGREGGADHGGEEERDGGCVGQGGLGTERKPKQMLVVVLGAWASLRTRRRGTMEGRGDRIGRSGRGAQRDDLTPDWFHERTRGGQSASSTGTHAGDE